jgi:hypothetical protein
MRRGDLRSWGAVDSDKRAKRPNLCLPTSVCSAQRLEVSPARLRVRHSPGRNNEILLNLIADAVIAPWT